MTTISTLIILVTVGIFIARQVLKKSTGNSKFDKLVRMPLSITNRLFYYSLLAGLSIATPYILTMIFVIATGDRYEGMMLAVIPALATVHLVFGQIFIKKKLLPKSLLTAVITALALGLVWVVMTNKIIQTGLDIYQFWDLVVTNFLVGLVLWETYFQIDLKLEQSKL